MQTSEDDRPDAQQSLFAPMPATCWTTVLSAGAGSETALETLCQLYWRPICAYLRRWSVTAQDAEDLTQMFLAHVIRKNPLARLDPARGRFRSYLLTALRHFVRDQSAKQPAARLLPVEDSFPATSEPPEVPDARLRPDQEFDRNFTLTLLEQAVEAVRADYDQRGQLARFEVLARFLPGRDPELTQADAAERLGLSEGALAKALHDLRGRIGESFRRLVGQTVASYEDVEEEISHHLQLLAG